MSALRMAIPLVCLVVEKIRGRGNGEQKKSTAARVLKVLMEALDEPGVGHPGDEELGALIDAEVRTLNQQRALIGKETVVAEGIKDPQLVAMGLRLIKESMDLLERGGLA